jgi:lipopolysaccharide transport system ATP-binding protein
MSDALIELQNVSVNGIDTQARAQTLRQWFVGGKSLRPIAIPIITALSLTVRPGDRLGVLGLNGSGKSSLLKVISGNYPIHAGTRLVRGHVVPLIEMGAGFDGELTGRRNIKVSYAYRGRLRDYNKAIEEQIIAFAELGDKIDLPLKTYSSGMAARLAFASAIFQRPDILLLDEIFAAGDAVSVEKSTSYMKKKWEEAAISIIVSHGTDDIEKLCNRCIIMQRGTLVADGTPSEIIADYHRMTHAHAAP